MLLAKHRRQRGRVGVSLQKQHSPTERLGCRAISDRLLLATQRSDLHAALALSRRHRVAAVRAGGPRRIGVCGGGRGKGQ
jgi:hypothetical protein